MSIRLGTNIIAGRAYQPSLLDMKWSDHIIYDPSWLRADDWSWHYSSYATPAYNHLVTEWDAGNTVVETETVAGISISYRRAADGHKIVLSDYASIVEQIYSATGVAWYYILDITNTRFKLPRTKWGFTGLRGTVGNYVAPGLPNITGGFTVVGSDSSASWVSNVSSMSGAFYGISVKSGYQAYASSVNNTNSDTHKAGFNAARSSSIYGNSNTVQPAGTQMYLYFYCGNSAQSALETTAGINTVLFEGKVDKGHEVIAFQEPTSANNWTWYRKYADGWVEQGSIIASMPSSKYQDVVFPVTMANTSYAPIITASWSESATGQNEGVQNPTITGMRVTASYDSVVIWWQVRGMAA